MMTLKNRTRIESLFDDADEPLIDPSEDLSLEIPTRSWPTIAAVIGGALIVAAMAWSWLPTNDQQAMHIQLVGSRVGQLQPGATVVLGGVEIGRVDAVDYEDDQPVADLILEEEIACKLPGDSTFSVKPLNHSVPRNMGVEVVAGDDRRIQLPPRVVIADDSFATRFTDRFHQVWDDEIQPSSPTKSGSGSILILVAALATIVAVLLIGMRILRATSPVLLICVLVIACIAFSVHQEVLSLERVQQWISTNSGWWPTYSPE